ncbi:MAG: hypothetical protein WKF36_08260 [Candidatus Nitrosocosmicus sp.]
MSSVYTLLTIFNQDLPIRRCTENDISFDDETMALVAEVRKNTWIDSQLTPKISPIFNT